MKSRIIAQWLALLLCVSASSLVADVYDNDPTNLQTAFARFPRLIPLTNNAGEPAFQTIDLTNGFYSNGKIFYAFTFQCPHREKHEDLIWSFVDPGVYFHWYILPQSGEMPGFTQYDTRSKADYMGPDLLFPLRGRTLYVQNLCGDSLEDGTNYLIWFHFSKKPPPKLSLAFTFGNLPADTNLGRAISKVMGLTHPASAPVVNPANHHSYILLRRNNWQRSEQQAVKLGGHLATVHNQAEEDWIAKTFGDYGGEPRLLWIGLSDTASKTHLSWSSGESVSYTDWASGAPTNSGHGKDYVAIYDPGNAQAGKWNDWPDQTQNERRLPMNGVAEIIPANTTANGATPVLADAGAVTPGIQIAPSVIITNNSASVRLEWPISLSDCTLEATPNQAQPFTMFGYSERSNAASGLVYVAITNPAPEMFFRLRKP